MQAPAHRRTVIPTHSYVTPASEPGSICQPLVRRMNGPRLAPLRGLAGVTSGGSGNDESVEPARLYHFRRFTHTRALSVLGLKPALANSERVPVQAKAAARV